MHSEIYNEKYSIQVGGNQLENDELVKKSSQKSLWFHLDGVPSAHGILTTIDGANARSRLALRSNDV